VAVPDELEGGHVVVAAGEQPRQLGDGDAQGRPLARGEQPVVAGVATAVAVLVGHCGANGAQVETPAPTMRIGALGTTWVTFLTPFMSLSS
jgi:hypothetical protein